MCLWVHACQVMYMRVKGQLFRVFVFLSIFVLDSDITLRSSGLYDKCFYPVILCSPRVSVLNFWGLGGSSYPFTGSLKTTRKHSITVAKLQL